MRTICSGCSVHLGGNPTDPVVSHGACSPECFVFYGALKEHGAELLSPDPHVAEFAVRLPSQSEPGKSYEVAMLLVYRETLDRYGEVVDAPSGPAWECDCGPSASDASASPTSTTVRVAAELRALWIAAEAKRRRRSA